MLHENSDVVQLFPMRALEGLRVNLISIPAATATLPLAHYLNQETDRVIELLEEKCDKQQTEIGRNHADI